RAIALILQERVKQVLPRMQSDFGKKADFTLEELVTIGHPHRLSLKDPIRNVVLASGHSSLYAESIPLVLGGLFTFSEGGWAEIRWDERSLLERHRPFPTGRILIGGDYKDSIASTWNQAKRTEKAYYQNDPRWRTRTAGYYRWRDGPKTESVAFNDKL